MYEFLPPLFKQLTPQDFDVAMQRLQALDVEPGVTIIQEGDEDPSLVVVMRGEVDVHTGDTKLGQVGAGDLLGEMALFSKGLRTATATTRSACKLLLLDRSNYEWLRQVQHPLAFLVETHALELLTDRLRMVGDRISSMAEGTDIEHVTPSVGFFSRVASAFGSGGMMYPGDIDGAAVLGKTVLFDDVEPKVLQEVASHFFPVAARRGHFLCTEGETGNDMFVLASGVVDVIVATQGDKVEQVAALEAGEAFGMCALVQPSQPRMASCVVREKMTGLSMGKITWAEQANRYDKVGSALRVAMIRSLGDQLAYANAQLNLLDMQHKDRTALLRAGAGVEAYGAHLGDERPSYLQGVD
jgi:CRP/FNR family transcriptional regulator